MKRLRFSSSDKIFFTADTHFGHSNILRLANLPFSSIEEKDELQINNWNKVVPQDGIVIHAGDFALKCHPKRYNEILYRLNGSIYLCEGSHDRDAYNHPGRFTDVQDTYYITIGMIEIFVSHYNHKVWPKSHYGSFQVHGHSHSRLDAYNSKEGKIFDACVESNNYTPVSLERVIEIMNTRPDNFNIIRK